MVFGISIEYTAESIFNFSCDGDASNLRNAINAVSNVNDMYRTSMGSTALHAAANNSHIDCVRILLDEDIDIECKDFEGCSIDVWFIRMLQTYNRKRSDD